MTQVVEHEDHLLRHKEQEERHEEAEEGTEAQTLFHYLLLNALRGGVFLSN